MLKRGVSFAVGLALFLSVLTLPAQAANFNLTTSPLPVLLSAKPGTSVSTDLRVQNSGTATATIKVGLRKFKASGTTGSPEILPRGSSDSYFDWVHFSQTSFTAQPEQWTTVKMTIDVPASAAFGYYYAVIFSQDNAGHTGTVSKPGSTVNAGTAILVLLNARAPGEKEQLSVTKFSADHKLYEYLPTNFEVEVKNTGNIYTAPSGTIFIKKGSHTIAQLDINPGNGNILPGSSRVFTATWNDGFPVFEPMTGNGGVVTNKKGQAVMSLHWDFGKINRLRFGHYMAHLVLVYNNGSQDVPIQGDVSFWVVPFKAMFGLIVLIVAGVFAWRWSVKRAVQKRIHKSEGPAKK